MIGKVRLSVGLSITDRALIVRMLDFILCNIVSSFVGCISVSLTENLYVNYKQ